MKKYVDKIAFLALVAVAVGCFLAIPPQVKADSGWGGYGAPAAVTQIFSNVSTTTTSTPIFVGLYRHKTLTVTGIAVSGHTAASLAGTVAVKCSPDNSLFVAQTGDWTTAAGVALSTTSNTNINWTDACQWLELVWTKTTGEVSAWLSLGN